MEKTALLTNFLPPYRIPLFQALEKHLKEFAIFISTPMEPNRKWNVDWQGLNVVVQKTLTLRCNWRHPHGFSETLYLHFPLDTLPCLLKYRPSIVISAELGLRTLQAAIYRRLNSRRRLVIWATLSEYTEQNRGRLRLILRRWLLHQADAVLVNGESGARYIQSFGFDDRKIIRFPQAVNQMALSNIPLERTKDMAFRILYVGMLIERKGLHPFIKALKRWSEEHSERSIELCLLGEGPLRQEFEELALPPNLSLRCLGNVEYGKIHEIYAEAGILAFPTLSDEWGLIVNEAMAAGLPVLGSLYSQAVEELVKEGQTGWIFHPDRTEEIYEAIGRALLTPRKRIEEMRGLCRAKVAGLTPENSARKLAETLESLY